MHFSKWVALKVFTEKSPMRPASLDITSLGLISYLSGIYLDQEFSDRQEQREVSQYEELSECGNVASDPPLRGGEKPPALC